LTTIFVIVAKTTMMLSKGNHDEKSANLGPINSVIIGRPKSINRAIAAAHMSKLRPKVRRKAAELEIRSLRFIDGSITITRGALAKNMILATVAIPAYSPAN
jgi:hypothetical protein